MKIVITQPVNGEPFIISFHGPEGKQDRDEYALSLGEAFGKAYAHYPNEQLTVNMLSPTHYELRTQFGALNDFTMESIRSNITDFLSKSLPVSMATDVRVTHSDVPNVLDVEFHIQPTKALQVLDLSNDPEFRIPFPKHHDGFMAYFDDECEYPTGVATNPIPVNTYWSYISSTFLNGFINYVKPIEAHLLNRYHEMEETLEEDCGDYPSYREGNEWIKPEGLLTKQEMFDLYTQPGRAMHSHIGMFKDDVILLASCHDERAVNEVNNMYMVFWFDQDVSDCCIGRFVTDDPKEVILEKFRAWIKGLDYGMTEMPLHFFQGWMSF